MVVGDVIPRWLVRLLPPNLTFLLRTLKRACKL